MWAWYFPAVDDLNSRCRKRDFFKITLNYLTQHTVCSWGLSKYSGIYGFLSTCRFNYLFWRSSLILNLKIIFCSIVRFFYFKNKKYIYVSLSCSIIHVQLFHSVSLSFFITTVIISKTSSTSAILFLVVSFLFFASN